LIPGFFDWTAGIDSLSIAASLKVVSCLADHARYLFSN